MEIAQCTGSVIMIFPADFEFNDETSKDNEFQNKKEFCQQSVYEEFLKSVEILKASGIHVTMFDKRMFSELKDIHTPDSVFPNNWLATNSSGDLIVFPMFAKNRQLETSAFPFIEKQLQNEGFEVSGNYFFSVKENEALEGTGSLIFDHKTRTAYCSLSKRSNVKRVHQFCRLFNYKPVIFSSKSSKGIEFYHTNIMLSIGDKFAIVCLEAIWNEDERKTVYENLANRGEVLEISVEQTEKGFCGNVLQLKNSKDESFIVMSETAKTHFSKSQIEILEKHGKILSLPIPQIEEIGGGSARCMICENFLPNIKRYNNSISDSS